MNPLGLLLVVLAAAALVSLALVWRRSADPLALPVAGGLAGLVLGVVVQVAAEILPGQDRSIGLLVPWFSGPILGALFGTAAEAARRAVRGARERSESRSTSRGAP